MMLWRLLDDDSAARPRTRHQTLSRALEWSYETLSAKERLTLAILTVFVGDFSLSAAEAVCAGTEEIQTTEVLTLVSRLVDKSMIVVVSQPEQSETRFKLLQIVSQFARKQIPACLPTVLPRLHAEFFVQWSANIRPLLDSANREECLRRSSANTAIFAPRSSGAVLIAASSIRGCGLRAPSGSIGRAVDRSGKV